MRTHTVLGERIVAHITYLEGAAREVIACHHERWDRSGYPRRLAGEQIPLSAPGTAALSRRELEIVRLMATGATNRQISEQLGVGEETIKTMASRLFIKLGAKRRAKAVAEAHSRGLL
jgi:DNA-binding NarL/FixJ family response regulator